MRPEYIEAVNAVCNGCSHWIIYILPTCLIWFSMLFRPFRPYRHRIALVFGVFVLSCFLYWYCVIFHANHIQAAKQANMQTQEEIQDWTADTWRVFAPIFAIPASLKYCTINLAAAGFLRLLLQRTSKGRVR